MRDQIITRRTLLGTVGAGLAVSALAPARETSAQDLQAHPVPAPGNATMLFDGKDLHNWLKRGSTQPATWKLENGVVTAGGGDIMTRQKFQDFRLHVEFMVPYMPDAHGQARGNSGVYLQGRYEIQVLDSYGKPEPGTGDCGAVYNQSAPLVNACLPALRWQTYDIFYRSPRFQNENLLDKPRVTVLQNGVLIQNNTEIRGNTVASVLGEDAATPGPVLLQDHGNPMKFRNIWIVEVPLKGSDKYE